MNYRHAFHAGNHADVLKHTVLTLVLRYMNSKPKPYRLIDTHAGAGRYDLAGLEAGKTGEWRDGIGRLDANLGQRVPKRQQNGRDERRPFEAPERANGNACGLRVQAARAVSDDEQIAGRRGMTLFGLQDGKPDRRRGLRRHGLRRKHRRGQQDCKRPAPAASRPGAFRPRFVPACGHGERISAPTASPRRTRASVP